MSRSRAVWAGSICWLVCCGAGCASLNNNDAVSSYRLPGEAEEDRGIITEMTSGMVNSVRASVGLGPNEEAARQQFAAAMDIYRAAGEEQGDRRAQRFDDAAKAFKKAAARWPNSSIEEDAMFFRAESQFFADRYPKAESIFGELISKYQSTKYIDKISQRRFQIAKFWLDHYDQFPQLAVAPNFTARERPTFDKFGSAIKILEQIRLDDPTGELADDATMLAASACFVDGRTHRADELLTDLRRSFPNSKHQYHAHLLGLKSKIRLYQGPSYDAGPLDAAEQLIRQMRRQFPNESAQDTEFLAKAYKDVRMNRAIREMNLARYRDRRQEYRAARIQYQRVAREFTDTSLAAEAATRLEELGDAPDLPPQRLEWLAKMFPEGQGQQPLIATSPTATRR